MQQNKSVLLKESIREKREEEIINYEIDFNCLLASVPAVVWKYCEKLNIKITALKMLFNSSNNNSVNVFWNYFDKSEHV